MLVTDRFPDGYRQRLMQAQQSLKRRVAVNMNVSKGLPDFIGMFPVGRSSGCPESITLRGSLAPKNAHYLGKTGMHCRLSPGDADEAIMLF